jgi:hypothetical protein
MVGLWTRCARARQLPYPVPRMAHQMRVPVAGFAFFRPRPLRAYWWFLLAGVLVGIDVWVGPYVQLPAAFVVPVLLAAWYSGLGPALALAVALPLTRLTLMLTVWGEPWSLGFILSTAGVRMLTFVFVAVVMARLAQVERALEREVEMLEGLLPICMYCKSIRNDAGQWEPIERYISHRSEASFTHGLCSACMKEHYPDVAERLSEKRGPGL